MYQCYYCDNCAHYSEMFFFFHYGTGLIVVENIVAELLLQSMNFYLTHHQTCTVHVQVHVKGVAKWFI